MPRIRYLKPEFFSDEDLSCLPFQTRLFFAGLWCYADKAGRLEYRPKYLKAMIFPYDQVKIEKEIALLASGGENKNPFILLYTAEEKQFIQIIHWDEHQKPHHTEKESKIPPAPPLIKGMGKGMGNQLAANFPLNNGELSVKEPLSNNNIYLEIISYLNGKTGREFRVTDNYKRFIDARLNEKFTIEDFKRVIDNQFDKWNPDEKMREFLRPETLFGTKFQSYLQIKPLTWQEKVRMAE